jgi:hypothetical protein
MAFNGSGTFNLPAGNPVVAGLIADPVVHNNTNTEIAVALSNCVTRDGQSPVTADIPMAGHKLTGLAAGTTSGDAVEFSQIPQTVGVKNKVINGDFDIWQIATTQNISGIYGGYGSADRWRWSGTGSSNTITQQFFVLGQTDVPYNPTFYHRSTVVEAAGVGDYIKIDHRIEDVRTLSGSAATLSFWAKADAIKSLSIEFSQHFGTGGAPSVAVEQIGVTKIALTTSWVKYTVNVTFPSITGKTLGTNQDDRLEIRFWYDAGSNFNANTSSLGHQTGTFDIAQVQLEPGSTATAFEQIPYATKLALCQRHLESVLPFWDSSFWVVAAAPAHYVFHVPFHVRKRVTPTVVADTAFETLTAVTNETVLSPTRDGVNIRYETYTGVAQNASIVFSGGDRFLVSAQL